MWINIRFKSLNQLLHEDMTIFRFLKIQLFFGKFGNKKKTNSKVSHSGSYPTGLPFVKEPHSIIGK